MTITCCGHKVITRFCPHCGKLCHGTAIYQLLEHVASQARIIRASVETMRADDHYQNNNAHFDSYFSKRERTARKWEEWHAALAELLQKDKEQESA